MIERRNFFIFKTALVLFIVLAFVATLPLAGKNRRQGKKFEEADVYFDKAAQCFSEINSLVNLVQLHLTTARLNLVSSRKDATTANLENAKKVAKDLGDPESVMKSITDIEEMLSKIDKI